MRNNSMLSMVFGLGHLSEGDGSCVPKRDKNKQHVWFME
jgi:hypothetical protein